MDGFKKVMIGEACDSEGPRRQSAASLIEMRIVRLMKEVNGYRSLLEVAQKLENNGPAEEMLWKLISAYERKDSDY